MRENTIQRYSVLVFDSQALRDQVHGSNREVELAVPYQLSVTDLLVSGVGDVPTQHVVQQDAQGPYCEA